MCGLGTSRLGNKYFRSGFLKSHKKQDASQTKLACYKPRNRVQERESVLRVTHEVAADAGQQTSLPASRLMNLVQPLVSGESCAQSTCMITTPVNS